MTSYLARTETLKEEKDLRMFHPKEMQCDRRDVGDEQCKLTEEPMERKKMRTVLILRALKRSAVR